MAVVEEWGNYKKTAALLQEIENKHQAMIDGSMEAICYSHDGMHVDANRAYLDLFGYGGLEELEGVPVLDLIDKSDHARFKRHLRKADKNNKKPAEPQEFQARKKDGSKAKIYVSVSVINIGGEDCTQIVVDEASKHGRSDTDSGETGLRDPLTGVYKRDYFLQALAKAIGQVKGGGKASALLYVELDGLKAINERFGKAAGDRLLRQVADYFGDTIDNAVISRFGGDEFAVIQTEFKDRQGAADVATKIIAALSQPLRLGDHEVRIGVTIGIAVYPTDGTDASQLQRNADLALYVGKAKGKNTYVFYDSEMSAKS
ncbi:MAG: diguanylate cyclase [Proteobacteria bacterium]|nr:diguanylate cyclase [Pseudomonadota bacterium]